MGEWFAVRTHAGAEGKALIGIEAAHMQAFLPVELVRTNYRGNHRQACAVIWRPVFLGHVFAMLNPARDLPALRATEGVDDVVRRDGRPVPVADEIISAIRRAERDGLFDLAAGCRLPGAG
jgi:Transcription termination factor nusG